MNLKEQKGYSICSKLPGGGSIEDFEDSRCRVEQLFERLRLLGVELSIEVDGLGFDAPIGVLTRDLLTEMRTHRSELIAILRRTVDTNGSGNTAASVDEVADFAQRPEGDCHEMDGPIEGVRCPHCPGDRFEDVRMGWRCVKCDRLAWCWIGGALVRMDVEQEKF